MIRKPIKSASDPSDLDLMLYADGELEGEERAAVEAYLARLGAGRAKIAALGLVSGVVRDQALGAAEKATGGIADAVMAKIAAEEQAPSPKPIAITSAPRALKAQAPQKKPANDNSRRIFALAAVAFAAAAGLMIWSRVDSTQTGHGPVASTSASSAIAEDELGVEVAAIDFGARMGTIFYVPTKGAASNVTTTVVWLNDDDNTDDDNTDDGSSGEE